MCSWQLKSYALQNFYVIARRKVMWDEYLAYFKGLRFAWSCPCSVSVGSEQYSLQKVTYETVLGITIFERALWVVPKNGINHALHKSTLMTKAIFLNNSARFAKKNRRLCNVKFQYLIVWRERARKKRYAFKQTQRLKQCMYTCWCSPCKILGKDNIIFLCFWLMWKLIQKHS